MSRYLDPRYTIALLDVVKPTQEEWNNIHHEAHNPRRKDITPENHRKYCLTIKQFRPGNRQDEIAKKLEQFMLNRLYAKAQEV